MAFTLAYEGLFDQAGVYLRAAPDTWVKAGVEFSDGLPQLGAVSRGRSRRSSSATRRATCSSSATA